MDINPETDPVDHGLTSVNATADLTEGTGALPDDGEGAAPEVEVADDHVEEESDDDFEGRDPLRFNNWMKRSATGAILTGITIGLQQALEVPRKPSAFVIEANDEPDDEDRPIELRFDPDSPTNTVAIIRRPAAPNPPDAP